MSNTVKETSRSFVDGEREFFLTYRLSAQTTGDGRDQRHSITAFSVEKSKASTQKESTCSVHIMNLSAETSLRLFELIAQAESPVFPCHLADIVRDQIHGMSFCEVTPSAAKV
ncbi:MAG TPA: hypothetical protein GXX23_02305 [Firmicutes bacterium]|nr:hypothetical protein [Candidatus Fermentithermobacillaceae bacterium]